MKLLRERRLAQGWSQQDLANRVGCTKQHISDLERGRVRPSLLLLHRLADVLRIPDTDLLMDSIAEVSAAAHDRPGSLREGSRDIW